jgi:hypothetical protein
MASDLSNDLEERRKFLDKRSQLPPEELARYAGRWVAWSPDGARIVAHSVAPEDLDDLILRAGADPERCIVEGIPEEDTVLGGGGFGQEHP